MQLNRRRLGKTEKMVTELSFGAMNLRSIDTIAQAKELINFVLDSGINLIDTARAYNGDNISGELVESEVLVGDVIASRTDLKEPIVIITKGHGYTPEDFDCDLEESLERLGVEGRGSLKIGNTEIILVYLFHGLTTERWKEMKNSGVLEHSKRKQEEGFFNYIGFSSHYSQTVEIQEAIETDVFDVCELPYNIYNRSLCDPGHIKGNLFALAAKHDMGIINMKAFSGNGYDAAFRTVFKDYISISYTDMLRFCLANPYITTIDAGAKYISEFQTDLAAAEAGAIQEEEITALIAQADQISPLMTDTCRECMHCMEKFSCPQNIDFPKILSLYTRYRISKSLGKDAEEFGVEYDGLELQADECTACGQCLPWCEYELKIPEDLEKAHTVFTA